MFRIERINPDGSIDLMMASPHRVTIGDLRGPSGPSHINQGNGAFYMNDWPTPGNKTVFSGRRGSRARVRWHDTVVEEYDWVLVPVNEFDPDPERPMIWGWQLASHNYESVPFEELHPLAFIG